MLPKINVYATLAALLLFFLPWFYVATGEGFGIVTQSGLGASYGSLITNRAADGTHDMAFAPLVIVALLATLAAAIQALSAFRDGWLSLRVGMATAVALVCLLGQAQHGFPLQRATAEAVRTNLAEYGPVAALMTEGLFGSKGLIAYRWPFYLELAALSIPTLILFDGMLNLLKRRKV